MYFSQLGYTEITMNLYENVLMDHYRSPRNRGTLEDPDFVSGTFNPSCGDSVSLQGHIKKDAVVKLAFEGYGCVISQATASMLTEFAVDKSIVRLENLDKEDILKMIHVPLGPTRLKCALLALQALHRGLARYQEK